MGGKATRIQQELEELDNLIEIMNILKDVATNRFYIYMSKKPNLQPYFDSFFDFFEMLGHAQTTCPLVRNNHPEVDMLIVASDQNFMSQLNSKVARTAYEEHQQKYYRANVVCIGKRGAEKCRALGMKVDKIFPPADFGDHYSLSVKVKEYLIDRVLSGQTGEVIVVHLWAKTFNVFKPRVQMMLPATELMTKSVPEGHVEVGERLSMLLKRNQFSFIPESSIDQSMLALTDIWVQSRILEIIAEVSLVEFAVLAAQLEAATESLNNERRLLVIELRKARREQINKSMREIFAQSKVMKAKAQAA